MVISSEPILANRTLVVINVATQAPLKLTNTTYFPWKKQFDALLIGYDLYGFIDGTLPCPSPNGSKDAMSPNPDYVFWIRQDSLLLGAILASLSKEVHQFVASAETSKKAWHQLAMAFAKPSRPRLLRLRERLICSQGSRSITDYLNDVKGATDELALIDNPVSNDEITLYVINGLSNDFKEISVALCTRETSISFEELYEKLVEHSHYIKRTEVQSEDTPITAHAANLSSTSTAPNSKSNNFQPQQNCFFGTW